MSRRSLLYLEDILDCMNKIDKYIAVMSFEDFDQNQLVIDADEQIIWQIITSDFKRTKPLIKQIVMEYR